VPRSLIGFAIGRVFGALFDARQLVAPEPLEGPRPFEQRPNAFQVGAIEHLTSVAPCLHEADIAKDLQMFRDGGLAQPQRGDDLTNRVFANREVQKDLATAAFGDGIEDVSGNGSPGHEEDYIPITEYVNCLVPRVWTGLSCEAYRLKIS
jgi:hypothetical protein